MSDDWDVPEMHIWQAAGRSYEELQEWSVWKEPNEIWSKVTEAVAELRAERDALDRKVSRRASWKWHFARAAVGVGWALGTSLMALSLLALAQQHGIL
jgi:hypothetical protein